MVAERMGFEPTVRLLTVQRFSKPPPSTSRPPLRQARSLPNAGGDNQAIAAARLKRRSLQSDVHDEIFVYASCLGSR